jgi:hypothetical protein
MTAALLALWLSFQPTDSEARALQSTDAVDLTVETATRHLAAATLASRLYGVDRSVLLAVAWHESRYVETIRTPESGRRESCGVMTPVPKRRCDASELTAVGGYLAGAEHLALWMSKYPDRRSLVAYAGGGGLVRACARGHWWVRPGVDACDVARQFERRAAAIRRAISAAE